jgi:hypothetical protein
MSKSQTVSPSQPNSSPPEIPDHLLRVFETISNLAPSECYRLGGAILQDIGIAEPSLFRKAEPQEIGEMFRQNIKPDAHWLSVCSDLSRFMNDPRMMAVALLRISAIRLVGKG